MSYSWQMMTAILLRLIGGKHILKAISHCCPTPFRLWQEESKITYLIHIPKCHKAVVVHPAELSGYDVRVNKNSYGKIQNPIVLSSGKHRIEYKKMEDNVSPRL